MVENIGSIDEHNDLRDGHVIRVEDCEVQPIPRANSETHILAQDIGIMIGQFGYVTCVHVYFLLNLEWPSPSIIPARIVR